MAAVNEDELIAELRGRLQDTEPLEEEPDFFTSDETLRRYLVARQWNVSASVTMLKATIEHRREKKPHNTVCRLCVESPGRHVLRQVGFDLIGRPVLYCSYTQCNSGQNFSVEEAVEHFTYVVENAIGSMCPPVYQMVLIIDFTGVKVAACNPKLAYATIQILTNHYPERMGLGICINHNVIFHGFWKVIKGFIDPNTRSKVHLLRSHHKMDECFKEILPEEFMHWLYEEIRLNKMEPTPKHQKEFWKKPPNGEHDSRGCDLYVKNVIDTFTDETLKSNKRMHKPHLNIVSALRETCEAVDTRS